jgi:hypothetical protein
LPREGPRFEAYGRATRIFVSHIIGNLETQSHLARVDMSRNEGHESLTFTFERANFYKHFHKINAFYFSGARE